MRADQGSAVDILEHARALIAEPERWTQGALARDGDGEELGDAQDPDAACWCLAGALHHAGYGRATSLLVHRVLSTLDKPVDIVTWNDAPERSHAQVLLLLDECIALAR